MREICSNCTFWEFEQADDSNYRYGWCQHAYDGADEAYPWSEMLLKVEGPTNCTDRVTPKLLTGQAHYCADWIAMSAKEIEERGVTV